MKSISSLRGLLCCILFGSGALAGAGQFTLHERAAPTITKNGLQQVLADCGGLNNPQLSLADLDDDGRDELYVFDRDGDVHLAFEVPETLDGEYRYAPELVEDWPTAVAFALLRDFDGDGVPDLFSHGDPELRQGILVHRGFRQNDGRLRFERVGFPDYPANVLHFADASQDLTLMYVAISDVPAIEDLDGDGDLDVLSFNSAGGYIDHYENVGSRAGDARSFLRYERATRCYGGIYETGLDGEVRLADAPGNCAPDQADGPLAPRDGFHPGSTLTPADVDGDGDLDLLLGDVNTPFVTVLTNAPAATGEAFFTDVGYDWPTSGVSVDLDNFPAVYALNGTTNPAGILAGQYISTPSNPGGGEDYNCVWRYSTNATGTPEPQLAQRDFLTREAFDHGRGCHVAWSDFNGDGREDMLVGNDSRYQPDGSLRAELAYYEADGTGGYTEATPSWLGTLNAVLTGQLLGLDPTTFDMDGDGDEDLLIGNDLGYVSYAENVAGPGQAVAYAPVNAQWMGIDVGTLSSPTVEDLTGDGLPDLLVGERRGKLAFFPNVGTATQPMFASEPAEESYGGIDVRIPGSRTGVNTRPELSRQPAGLTLYVGTGQGRLLIYHDLPTAAGGTAKLWAEQTLHAGVDLSPSIGVRPGDKFVATVGTSRGGLAYYDVDLFSITQDGEDISVAWSLSPNPSRGQVQATGLSEGTRLRVTDPLGRVSLADPQSLDFLGRAAGVYTLEPIGTEGIVIGSARRLVVLP